MLCEFPHVEKCISTCGYTQGAVYFRMCKFTILCGFPMWKSESPLADIHKVQWITACGDTLFNVNSLMRIYTRKCEFPRQGNSLKFNFPHIRMYAYCEFPLVEMHPNMCISAVRIYTNLGVLPHVEIHSLMWFPTWGKVYFRRRGFPHF